MASRGNAVAVLGCGTAALVWDQTPGSPALAQAAPIRARIISKSIRAEEVARKLSLGKGAGMDIVTAYAVLGLEPDCSLEEAKHSFRSRAMLLHPDKVEGALRSTAETAMGQLNTAYDVVQQDFEHGRPRDGGRSASSQPVWSAITPRSPIIGECDICGYWPAKPIVLRQITGAVIAWRSRSARLELCRACAEAFYAESQVHCMLKGWWGALAIYANPVVMVINRISLSNHQNRLATPQRRDPAVITPFSSPITARPAFVRPLPVMVSILVVLFCVGFWVYSAANPSSPVAPIVKTTEVGSCLTEGGRGSDCSDSLAVFRLTSEVSTPDACTGEAFTSQTTHKTFCATRIR